MKVGTKSILFGAHCFFIHPWFVALAWWKLYGFPKDPRLWIAFFVHDLGYWGKPNMDGPEGETHPELGAFIMEVLFGIKWSEFCIYHSRFYAKRHRWPFSRLCIADKLAIALTPTWLYVPMAMLSGEIKEYLQQHDTERSSGHDYNTSSKMEWHRNIKKFMAAWVKENKDKAWDELKRPKTPVGRPLPPKHNDSVTHTTRKED